MDIRFFVSSVDLTERDKSGNEANLTLVTCRVVDTLIQFMLKRVM